MAFALTHQILVLDAYLEGELDSGSQAAITKGFVGEFLDALGLEALGPIGIYPAADVRAPGWSFLLPITTSHISGHYFEKPGDGPHMRLDAYSCDSLDWNELIKVCHRHFRLGCWSGTFIDRQIDKPGERNVLALSGCGDVVTREDRLIPQMSEVAGERMARQILLP